MAKPARLRFIRVVNNAKRHPRGMRLGRKDFETLAQESQWVDDSLRPVLRGIPLILDAEKNGMELVY